MRFVRPAADLQQFRVTPEPFDVVLANVAIAAERLDRAVCDALAHITAVELDSIRVDAVSHRIQLQLSVANDDIQPTRKCHMERDRRRRKCSYLAVS